MIKGFVTRTILQYMFIRKRMFLFFKKDQKFIEIGSGDGDLYNLLVNLGFTGFGVDLNESACGNNSSLNADSINFGKYKIANSDFNNLTNSGFDFLTSSMVIEHIPDLDLIQFISNAKKLTKPNGKLIFLIPFNINAWVIEDEIAGHVKRYTFKDSVELPENNGLMVDYKLGLNYPFSNCLLRPSNRIVNQYESHMKLKTELEKTIYIGNGNVKYKSIFPSYLNIVLNEIARLPLYWLRRLDENNEKSLVMYFQ